MTDQKRLSFEFFPPKTEAGAEKLKVVRTQLAELNPEFFSVTYGAGGSTRDNTKNIVQAMKTEGLSVAPHLSFGGDDHDAMHALLSEYQAMGVDRIVALRGDMPSGMGGSHQMIYANQLVSFIRENFGEHFHLEVAAYPEIHPESKSYESDISYLKSKFEAGANSAITQYFFNADAYLYYADACQKAGITQPIYPGIMPITNFTNLSRFSDNCGAEIPRWLRKRMESYGEDTESIKQFGLEVIIKLCENLLKNDVPGLHFYTMNQIEPTQTIVKELGL